MVTKGYVNYENLKAYDEQLKKYIEEKIAEAIETYRVEDENNDNVFIDNSEE